MFSDENDGFSKHYAMKPGLVYDKKARSLPSSDGILCPEGAIINHRKRIVKKLLSRLTLAWLLLIFAMPVIGQDDEIERPSTESLLPETTVMFFQVGDVKEFVTKMQDTGVGQMFQHPEVSSLVDGLYGEAKEMYEDVKEDVGLELEDMRDFPSGEISIAVVAPKRADLQVVVMLEIDEESDAVKNIFQRGEEFLVENGESIETDDSGDVPFRSFKADGTEYTTFIKDGLFVSSNSAELAQQMIDRWMGREVEKIRPLTENRKFVTVMNRCRGTKETPPDFRFFIDPIEMARGVTRGNIGAQTVINFLPIFGLDGLSAIGGSAIMDELGFESVGHVHVMLANPRAGLFKMLALRPGEYQPESWMPADVTNYVSTSWDLNQAIVELAKIVDTFQGEGTFQDEIDQNINEELELDFHEDILSLVTGRITYSSRIEFPATFTSQVHVVAIELDDLERFEDFRQLMFEKLELEGDLDDIQEVVYKGVSYWTSSEERQEQRRQFIEGMDERAARFNRQDGEFCVGVVGKSLIICSSPKFMEKAIETERGEHPALVDDPEFKETTDTMVKLLRNDMPGAIFYNKPASGFEMLFDIAKGDDLKAMMDLIEGDDEDEPTPYVSGFRQIVEDNELPDFNDVRSFFAPGGGFITNDDTGYHLMTFQLKYDR